MNYGELRTQFKDVLDRSDCTDAQADTFINMGLRRTERLLRTPIQKTTTTITVDGAWPGFFMIPTDYLGIFSVAVDDIPCPRITSSQLDKTEGFLMEDNRFTFLPDLAEGQVLRITYYNEFLRTPGDEVTTDYSLVLTDVITYAALVFACDTFVDERKRSFEGTLQDLIRETQMMSDIDEMAGGGMAISVMGTGLI